MTGATRGQLSVIAQIPRCGQIQLRLPDQGMGIAVITFQIQGKLVGSEGSQLARQLRPCTSMLVLALI